MKFFQKNKKVDTDRNLLALAEQEIKEMRETRAKISRNLDLCIQGIRSIQRMEGIPEEEII